MFAGPVLLSTDVFSYIAYARMGVEHGLNPYLHGPVAISHDPVFRYVGHSWLETPTAYGPLYTLISYPFAPLGLKGAVWAMKLEALLASAGTLALVWRCARARGFDPVPALLAVGANPLYVIYGLGGAHNDLLMMLAMMAAVALMLTPRAASPTAPRSRRRRGARRGSADQGDRRRAAAVHDHRAARSRPVVGALAALAVGALVAFAAFGSDGVNIVAALNRDAALVSTDSFPNEIAHLFGKPGVFPIDHDLLKIALVLIGRTWRGAPGAATTGSPPRAGRCWRSRSRARGCSPGTSCGRCRSRSSAATGGCCSPRSRCRRSTWPTSSRRCWCR